LLWTAFNWGALTKFWITKFSFPERRCLRNRDYAILQLWIGSERSSRTIKNTMKRGKIGHCLKPDLLAYIHLSPSLFPSLFGCSSVNIVWFLTHGQCKRHRSEVRFQNLARCESKSALRNYPKFIKIRDIPPTYSRWSRSRATTSNPEHYHVWVVCGQCCSKWLSLWFSGSSGSSGFDLCYWPWFDELESFI